jgi:hypothetical protein
MDLLTSDINRHYRIKHGSNEFAKSQFSQQDENHVKSAITSTALRTSGFWQKLGLRGLEEFTNLFQTLPQRM